MTQHHPNKGHIGLAEKKFNERLTKVVENAYQALDLARTNKVEGFVESDDPESDHRYIITVHDREEKVSYKIIFKNSSWTDPVTGKPRVAMEFQIWPWINPDNAPPLGLIRARRFLRTITLDERMFDDIDSFNDSAVPDTIKRWHRYLTFSFDAKVFELLEFIGAQVVRLVLELAEKPHFNS